MDHTIKEQPDKNLVEINSLALSYVEGDEIENVINFSGFRFEIQTDTFSMDCFVRLSLFFTSNNVFSGLSFVSSVDLRILASHRLIDRKEELSDSFKRIKVNGKHKVDLFGLLSGDKKTPWYKQLADNSCYIVEGIREKVHGMLSKNSYIGINDYFIKNMISGGTAITFTFYDKSNDEIANVEIDLRKFVVFYSKTYGIYVDGLHNSFNVDILGLGAFSEYYRVSCTSSSLISQFIRPFTLFGEFAEKQIIKPENIVMGDAQTLACIKLETSHGLGDKWYFTLR
ncbi:hypothetical protein THOM_2637 [Trachipleistophora hominis]|uniref:Uncharacterized protein n=1 Tax=Trachipleistophora hominis TaxID=72359 RepID=L7JSJ7_TRAHO|nr:hypothetical protein THOM_2637 [Trachipleistophora hominis]